MLGKTIAQRRLLVILAAVSLATARPASSQSDPTVELTVPKGRPLRVTLTADMTVRRVGQTVTATLTEPVYAYDRIVLPAGTEVRGRITKLENPPAVNRVRSMAGGDFSPHRTVEIRFDAVVRDGRSINIDTIAAHETPHAKREVARDAPDDSAGGTGVVAKVEHEAKNVASEAIAAAKQKAAEGVSAVKDPEKMERLKEWGVNRLPYHPQVLRKGTAYDAELQAPLTFGEAPVHAPAPEGTLPAPASILHAQLATTLDSESTPRGAPLEAIVTEPVFAQDGRLVLPAGARLTGEVTLAQPARRFHRNGQLRFLFERVELPDQQSAPLLASLHAIDVSGDDHIALDDEGGAAVQNSKTRFVEPALALLALRGSLNQGEGAGGFEGGASGVRATPVSSGGGNYLARGVGGLIGFGAIGAALSQVSRPLGVAFGVLGAARSVYTNVLGKGQALRFQADTPIEVRLAPGPSAAR